MKFQIKILIAILFLSVFFLNKLVFAQNNSEELLISWEALNYTPYDFYGKNLPSPGSTINVGFDFVQNGKIVDLSQNKIYWYINDNLVSNDKGVKEISFIAPNLTERVVEIRIELPDFNVIKLIEIPIVKPRLIINAPFPKKEINMNEFEVSAIPYFFNLKKYDFDEININWSINGIDALGKIEDPFVLPIKVLGNNQTIINIQAYAQNVNDESETALDEINLIFKK
ncbi:MAG: hypothetical protein ACP5QN_00395 [Minisyncoccia bacterium]